MATLLLYLTAVEVGGNTIFPQLGLSLAPSLGSLVACSNIDSHENPKYKPSMFMHVGGRCFTRCSGAMGRRTAGCSTPAAPSSTATRELSPRTQTGSHKLLISAQEKKESILYFE